MKYANGITASETTAVRGTERKSKSRSKVVRRSTARGRIGADTPPRVISPDERQRMTATAAYYLAERRGFATGCELEDWCTAETEIDQLLKHY